ncbi:MAG: hypothetical protein B9S32_12845 [Verrucomicrobia bacterium Tous-C9LFEB]|nr:MAG: hypothetical protein B9S32_12845 [Verrucomicrobia bacterium Tous-C9LFEB]
MADPKKPISPQSGVVTFLDVLGWKGVYDRQSNAIKKLTDLIEGLENHAKTERGGPFAAQIKSISDTIAIFSFCEEMKASGAIEMHGRLCQWVIPESITSEIPVRGATSYGEFEISSNGNIFVGKAVDEAASWHEQSDWIGVHLTPSAEYIFKPEIATSAWRTYCPPNKTRLSWKPHCVNWVSDINNPQKMVDIKTKFRCLGPIVPEIAGKFANTLQFIDTISPQTVEPSLVGEEEAGSGI